MLAQVQLVLSAQSPYSNESKKQDHRAFIIGTLAKAKESMALACAGKIKRTPMKEKPMADVQKWIDELRAGKVVGRIVLKN